jgi:uncharacterized protein (TIGR00369 family)
MDALALETTAPEGFAVLDAPRGFVRRIGEFHVHDERPVLALRITADHLNSIGIAHGGLLATLADSAFGVVLKRQLKLAASPPTVSLAVDYLGPVREGDWVEAEVEVHKVGSRITNASCMVRASARDWWCAPAGCSCWAGACADLILCARAISGRERSRGAGAAQEAALDAS